MQWSLSRKISFRFLSTYLVLFIISNQFITSGFIDPLWRKVVPWFEDTFMNLPGTINIFTNGSGDTTYNWVSLLCYIVVALIVSIIWSVLDYKRENYDTWLKALVVLVRYYVFYQMLMYGLAKVFYSQFQFPSFARLTQDYGDSSPMGLLWTFMGYSKGYTVFTGIGETVAALLLLTRRTTTLGAIVTLAVMSNVMALNYFYDVPVKILSGHLVFMALFLILLDFRRLYNIFILNIPANSANQSDLFPSPELRKVKNIIKWIVLVVYLGFSLYNMNEMTKKWGTKAPKPILYGLYEVDSFVKNGDTIPPLLTEYERWQRLMIERKGFATIQQMDKKKIWHTIKTDTLNQSLAFSTRQDSTLIDTLYYSRPDTSLFSLKGVYKNDTLSIIFKEKKKEDFLLAKRGFHWVNEFPFNR